MVMKMVWGIYDINNHHKGGNRDMGASGKPLICFLLLFVLLLLFLSEKSKNLKSMDYL